MQRHSLLDDDDAQSTHGGVDVFGDDFEVDAFDYDGPTDGFRPDLDRAGSARYAPPEEPVRTVSAHYATTPVSPTTPPFHHRSSIRKSQRRSNPFASPEDENASYRERLRSLQFEPDEIARSASSASSHVYASTGDSRFAAGPSHPYGMYQQGTVARTASVTTTSTLRPQPRQSYSQNLPQHPYTMYPQAVGDDLLDDDDEDEDEADLPRSNPLPVGFPGLGQSYTRRLGPDGEDQDIIGADGHAEQLPPYTRYPEDGPEKMPLLVPDLPTALHSRAPVAGTDPGMPLMHTALQPSPSPAAPLRRSMTDASDLYRHASVASMPHLTLIPTSSSLRTNSRKDWKEKTWKEKRQTRFCGIPFWWILFALGVCIFIAAIVGGIVGGWVAGGNHARDAAAVTITSLLDASPIASPTGPPPPDGTFALQVGPPEEAQSDCLADPGQRSAWDCSLAPNSALGLVVKPPTENNGSGASVFYASSDTDIGYGVQLSNMNTSFSEFLTVVDHDYPDKGPAYYFQQFYDKIVVIPEYMLTAESSSNSKQRRRGWYDPNFTVPPAWAQRKDVIAPGEKPWFCVWNNTFLEGFIYISERVTSHTSSATTSMPTSAPTSSLTSATYTTSDFTSPPTSSPTSIPYTSTSRPPPTITEVYTAPWTTATYIGSPTGYPNWVNGMAHAVPDADTRPGEDGRAGYRMKREISPTDFWSQLESFPYVVKLEERRLRNNKNRPYCQQYQILWNGAANWVPDPEGNPIIVELDEQDPTWGAIQTTDAMSRKQPPVPRGCHCQWMCDSL